MDLNIAVSTASELFEDSVMVDSILMVDSISMGRENLKILASPGSESSGVSSLDAEEAKKLANEQLPSSSSPTLVSEPNSAVQTESESSDGGSSSSDDADDDKPSEQSPSSESDQSSDEQEQRSDANDDDGDDNDDDTIRKDDDDNKTASKGDENDAKEISFATIADNSGKIIDIDASSVGGQQQAPVDTAEQVTDAAKVEDNNASIDLDDAIRYKKLKVIYDGRDILDFGANVANKSWNIQYAFLPDQNFSFYFNNRSQYNRLSTGFHENPNHDYVLSKCGSCTFQYPVVITEKTDQMPPAMTNKNTPLIDLLMHTTAASCRLPPVQSATNVPAQRISPAIDLALLQNSNNLHSMNLNNNNNFMMNNRSQMMPPYQSGKPILKNADAHATAAAAVVAAAAANQNHTCYTQNNTNLNGTNAFFNRNINASTFNTLINQLGANGIGNNMSIDYLMNAMNGHSYGAHNHGYNHQNNNTNNNSAKLNQIAALASLMNRQQQQQQQHQQQQQQQQQQQWYGGMCPHNINKSGINFNANSHKSMPTYSNF